MHENVEKFEFIIGESMNIFKAQKKPNEVFNPRGEYNPDMYVQRPHYEEGMEDALQSGLCILVHGQSGTGKTWLTRRVLLRENIDFQVVNLASASNLGSIYECLKKIMTSKNWEIRTKRTDKMSASANAGVAKGELQTESVYENNIDYFLEFLKFMTYKANRKEERRYIVFENMETILNSQKLIKELSNLIILTDDDDVLKYKTKFIIIGATKDIHQYFRNTMNVNTIDNRIYELEDVGTLTVSQAKELIQRGFDKLEIEFESDTVKNDCITEYIRITGGIPQRIHELCLAFAQLCRKHERKIDMSIVNEAIGKWIKTSLNKNYMLTTRCLDSENAENSYTNKILFCIAQKDTLYFTKEEIDNDLQHEFPKTVEGKTTSSITTRILNQLCKYEPPLLSTFEDTFGQYAFCDFKCALCLRAILAKDEERVYKIDAYDI